MEDRYFIAPSHEFFNDIRNKRQKKSYFKAMKISVESALSSVRKMALEIVGNKLKIQR